MADTLKSRVAEEASAKSNELPTVHTSLSGGFYYGGGFVVSAVDVARAISAFDAARMQGQLENSGATEHIPAITVQQLAPRLLHPSPVAPAGQEYVDPYLFETGHFESRDEYEELSRTTKIKPRARA